MGRRLEKRTHRSHTLPSSPTHSSSSSDFEFTITLSPRKSSTTLCPADELFYKGQLLPLHLSPRLSMVRTLFLSSSSTSSSSADTTTTASRDSTGSSTDSHSSFSSDLILLASGDGDSSGRPSSVTADEDDPFNRLNKNKKINNKYFSLSRFSSVFRKESKARDMDTGPGPGSGSSVKRAKEVIRKYLKKAKPFYEMLSQKQKVTTMMSPNKCFYGQTTKICLSVKTDGSTIKSGSRKDNNNGGFSHSFSGNLRYPRKRSYVSSCPSSMMSSPCHSGILYRNGPESGPVLGIGAVRDTTSSSMEELQSAIQGAIAHCKNSMVQNNKSMVSNEI